MTKIEDAGKLVEQKSPNDVVLIHAAKIKSPLTHGVIPYSQLPLHGNKEVTMGGEDVYSLLFKTVNVAPAPTYSFSCFCFTEFMKTPCVSMNVLFT